MPTEPRTPAVPDIEEICRSAERQLARRFGGTQKITGSEELHGTGNSVVLRVRLAANPFLQERSLVVKYIPVTDDELDDAALVREIVAYQFTTSLPEEARPGPVLLAYDIDERTIVISDSGDGDTFADLLDTGDAEERLQILRNLGQALGRMHAATAEREQDFETLRTRLGRTYPDAASVNRYRSTAHRFVIDRGMELIRSVGITVPGPVEELGREAAKRLQGGRRAFTPIDLSPDNIIVAGRTQFLDYEWAAFRDVGFDLASVISGFPGFLTTRPISDDEADVFVDAWTHEVDQIWPTVRDDHALHGRLVTALLGVALAEVANLHYGSSHNVVDAVAAAAGDASIGRYPEDVTPAERLLAAPGSLDFSDAELMLRRDLFETFEALARFAGREATCRQADPRTRVVTGFAEALAELLDDSDAAPGVDADRDSAPGADDHRDPEAR